MQHFVTLKQLSEAVGVSESTLKRWSEQGELSVLRTAGGHRKAPLHEAVQLLRRRTEPGASPAALGIPGTPGFRELSLEAGRERMLAGLLAGDRGSVAATLFDLYLGGCRLSEIGDEVIAPVFHQIGELWGCGDVRVYEERRACECCLRGLAELGACLPPPGARAPLAIGATPAGDHYGVALATSELVLQEGGWRSVSLGSSVALPALLAALEEYAPPLLWLSATYIEDEDDFVRDLNQLWDAALDRGTALAVGGQALYPQLRRRLNYSAFCDTFRHLESFAAAIHPAMAERRRDPGRRPSAPPVPTTGGAA